MAPIKYHKKKLRGKHTIDVHPQIIRWRAKMKKQRKAVPLQKAVPPDTVAIFSDTRDNLVTSRDDKLPESLVKSFNFFGDETL